MRSFNSLRVGSFLAYRAVKRSSRYVTVLIVIILTLIFLNMVAVGGLLIGMMKGAEVGFVKYMFGTMTVKPLTDKEYIQRADELISFAKSLPGFKAYAPRITAGAKLEAHYKERKKGSRGDSVSAQVIGIDPDKEGQTTLFPSTIVEGRYLNEDDRGKIVLGSILAGKRLLAVMGQSMVDVYVGDKILVTFGNGVQREYEVVGIMKSKYEILDMEGFISLKEMQEILGITDGRITEIAIKTDDFMKADEFKKPFVNAGYDKYNLLQTWYDGIGAMMQDVLSSIGLITDIIGSIGLMVGGITMFIMIFINAVSKRRFIGVLKACGLTSASIVWSFVFQAVFYTVVAVGLGLLILYGLMIPYINNNPIDFAFADGIIYVTDEYVALRVIVLVIVSMVSGLVPAYMIAKENTLNAILQR
jgi:putative ABC transport system permease protein